MESASSSSESGPISVSWIVPFHNEQDNVDALVTACLQVLAPDGELVLVDDGSGDGTLAALELAERRDSRIRLVLLRRCFGKGAALAAGIEVARGERIVTIDGDLQENPEDAQRLFAALDDGADLASGWRHKRQDSLSKRLQSRWFHVVVWILTGRRDRDLNCGFKAMGREVADELRMTGGRFRFMNLWVAHWGFKVVEVPVDHRPRTRGRSRYGSGFGRLPSAMIDLFAVVCMIRYRERPGHLFVQLGSVAGGIGFLVCAYLTWIRFSSESQSIEHRYPLLGLGVLLIAIGVQLVATGFLGEWLAYSSHNPEPGYRTRLRVPPGRGDDD